MKKIITEEVKRLIRHGAAPLIAYLVAQGVITEEQGMNLMNAFIVIGVTAVAYGWSFLRAKFPFFSVLGLIRK